MMPSAVISIGKAEHSEYGQFDSIKLMAQNNNQQQRQPQQYVRHTKK